MTSTEILTGADTIAPSTTAEVNLQSVCDRQTGSEVTDQDVSA